MHSLLLPTGWVDFWGLPCHAVLAELIPPSSGEPRFMLPELSMLPPFADALSWMFPGNSPANHQHHSRVKTSRIRKVISTRTMRGCNQRSNLINNQLINPLECKGYYSAKSNSMMLVYWPLMVDCYIWYSEERSGQSCSPPRPFLAVPNVTASHQQSPYYCIMVRCSAVLMWQLKG